MLMQMEKSINLGFWVVDDNTLTIGGLRGPILTSSPRGAPFLGGFNGCHLKQPDNPPRIHLVDQAPVGGRAIGGWRINETRWIAEVSTDPHLLAVLDGNRFHRKHNIPRNGTWDYGNLTYTVDTDPRLLDLLKLAEKNHRRRRVGNSPRIPEVGYDDGAGKIQGVVSGIVFEILVIFRGPMQASTLVIKPRSLKTLQKGLPSTGFGELEFCHFYFSEMPFLPDPPNALLSLLN
ncbi:MAG: hypothetical protein CM15mP71_6710 [Candidatus Poseidoniales archaeon]|nr:MAG: hypothetical protein CM15mP71_6710 [Candidatus Poseidoniales archaeon]